MKLRQSTISFALMVTLVSGGTTCAQSAAERAKAEAAFAEVLELQVKGKNADAAARMKVVLKVFKKNPLLTDYLAELESLAGLDPLARHALQAPAEAEKTVDSLAEYLVQPAKTEHDKARVIFRWIADRIAYNAEGFFAGKPGDNSPEAVLKNRVAVCQGYADLFGELAKRAGLEVVVISGVSKGRDGPRTEKNEPVSHAWNAVKIEGRWQLLDSTWGAGGLNGKEFKKRYNEYYFLTPSEQLVLTHFPTDSKWQLLDTLVSRQEFEKWRRINADIFGMGFKFTDVRAKLSEKDMPELVEPLAIVGPHIVVQAAPLERALKSGKKYRFKIQATQFTDMVFNNAGQMQPLARKGDVFQGDLVSKKGDLVLGGKYYGQTRQIQGILRYVVE
jgi:hypothetical protein